MNWHFWVRATTLMVPVLDAAYFASLGSPAIAKGAKLAIGKKDCQRLVRHQARADVTPQAMAIHTHRRLRTWRHCEKLAAMGRDPDTARDGWDETDADGKPCLPHEGWLAGEKRAEAERFLKVLEEKDRRKG